MASEVFLDSKVVKMTELSVTFSLAVAIMSILQGLELKEFSNFTKWQKEMLI